MSEQIADAGTIQNTGEATAAATSQTPEVLIAPVGEVATGGQQQADVTQAQPVVDVISNADASSVPYEFKAPEGTKLDAAVISEFSTVAKELGLTQDAAQKIVEKIAPKLAERTATQHAEAFTAYRTELQAATKADAEYGGDKFTENLAIANAAVEAFGTPALRELLDKSGLGDHPEIVRAFYRAGKSISQDKFMAGSSKPSGAERDAAKVLYGKS
jgi:hypothetical protein